MKTLFIINSQIKKCQKVLNEITREFADYPTSIFETQFKEHAVQLAADAAHSGDYEYIIAVGGDGTLNEVLNGLMKANVPVNRLPALGILQRGSANDFSKTIPNSQTLVQLRELIDHSRYKKVDIGKVVLEDEQRTTKYFLNIVGLGLGPEVVKHIEKNPRIINPKISYFNAIIRTFLTYTKRPIICTSEDWNWEGNLLQMAIGNGRYFGDGICICPDAKIDDGIFHISLFGQLSMMDYLRNLNRLKKGIKITHSDACYLESKEVKIENKGNQVCGIEADGEYVGTAPAIISIVPKVINLLH